MGLVTHKDTSEPTCVVCGDDTELNKYQNKLFCKDCLQQRMVQEL